MNTTTKAPEYVDLLMRQSNEAAYATFKKDLKAGKSAACALLAVFHMNDDGDPQTGAMLDDLSRGRLCPQQFMELVHMWA